MHTLFTSQLKLMQVSLHSIRQYRVLFMNLSKNNSIYLVKNQNHHT